jgi:hypothetical protein
VGQGPSVRVFFDSSALIKRYVREKGTGEVLARCDQATELAVATIAWPELVSAFRRLVRENRLDETRYRALKADPAADLADAVLCEISPQIVQRAITALEAHPRHPVRRPPAHPLAGVRAQGTRRDPAADRSHGRVAHPRRAGRALMEGAVRRCITEFAGPNQPTTTRQDLEA